MLRIKRLYDVNKAKAILTHPVIWKAISDENSDIASFRLEDKRSHIHLMGYEDDEPVGLFIVHPNNFKVYFCHMHVLPKFRKRYSEEFGRRVIQWIWDNTSITELNASISEKFPNVITYAKFFGFKPVDYVPSKKRKKGNWLLRITKEDS